MWCVIDLLASFSLFTYNTTKLSPSHKFLLKSHEEHNDSHTVTIEKLSLILQSVDYKVMNNTQFRRLVLDTPAAFESQGKSVASKLHRADSTPSLGSRTRSNIPMTPYCYPTLPTYNHPLSVDLLVILT